MYRHPSNVSRTLMSNKIVDRLDEVEAVAIFILDSTPGFNGFGKDNRKTRDI